MALSASVQHPEKMNLLLLFIFMNSCHLAQCEMMGHSRATRRDGAEFTITHASPSQPSTPPTYSLLIPHGSAEYGWTWRTEGDGDAQRERERENVSLTEVASVTSSSPKQMWHNN